MISGPDLWEQQEIVVRECLDLLSLSTAMFFLGKCVEPDVEHSSHLVRLAKRSFPTIICYILEADKLLMVYWVVFKTSIY